MIRYIFLVSEPCYIWRHVTDTNSKHYPRITTQYIAHTDFLFTDIPFQKKIMKICMLICLLVLVGQISADDGKF